LLQLANTDRLVSEVVQQSRAQGLYDKVLVSMTANRRISYLPGQAAADPQERNAQELMRFRCW
jgi:hypothetical protein